jgi:lycopene cyclase domain-containing protein
MKSLYLLIHLFTISYPLAQSFEWRLKYATKWKALLPGLLITATFFIVWDVIFTRQGVWGFNHDYTMGVDFLHLPVEEWLFFITVPFASVFIYECILYFLPKIQANAFTKYLGVSVSILVLFVGIYNFERLYTFWNFLFGGTFLLFISITNPAWFGKFQVAYLFHLIPFFLVNGILTGTFLDAPVVWYNNDENLGLRILTVPIEDTVYSLLLLLMNVFFYEYFKKRFGLRT